VQRDADAHETLVNELGAPYVSGVVQDPPFHCERPPDDDMQKEELMQEMDVTDPQSPLVWCQPAPLYAKASPSPSTAAQYPEGEQPMPSTPAAPGTVMGADQDWPFQVSVWLPPVGRATQKDAEPQETEMVPGPIAVPSGACGALQAEPL
jgi:hypothetical protein